MDYLPPRSAAGTKKLMEGHRKGRTKPSNLREQVDPETMKMYPNTSSSRSLSKQIGDIGSLGEESKEEKGREGNQSSVCTSTRSTTDERDKKMYPTPRASGQEDAETLIKRKGEKAAAQHNLTAHMQMFPTPSSELSDGCSSTTRDSESRTHQVGV